jgi:hypothetical protein
MSQPPPRPPASSLGFELPEDLKPLYSNTVRISHTPAELVFDFARLLPGQTGAEVVARLILSPMGAKLFYRALAENLARYESVFGEINLPPDSSLAGELFRGKPPEPPHST